MVGNMGQDFRYDIPDNPTPWLNFITELANRYKNNPGMCGIYIWNEPPLGLFGFDNWYHWATLGVEALHDVNPNLLKLIDADLPNRNGIDEHWVDNPMQTPNVVYTFHDYYWKNYYYNKRDYTLSYKAGDYALAKQQMEVSMYDRFFKYAVEHDLCIILEEFGFNGGLNPAEFCLNGELNLEGVGYGNEPGWPRCMIDYMDLLKKYEIPWNQFNWWVKIDENYGLARSDYYTLSDVGEIWQQYLESDTPPPPPDELPPTEPIYTFDFETGDFPDNMNTQASAPNIIEISSAAPYSGSYSVNMVCPSGGRAVTIVKPGSLESVFVKAAFRLNQLPPKEASAEFSDGNYVELFSIVSNPPYTKICSLRLRATANTLLLDLVQSYPVETVTSYEVSIVAKKYYLMTLGFVKASDGGFYVDLDGELLLEETGIDTSGYPSPNTVYSGVCWSTGDLVLFMDDLEIAKLKE
jgi:hypothetical protein